MTPATIRCQNWPSYYTRCACGTKKRAHARRCRGCYWAERRAAKAERMAAITRAKRAYWEKAS